MKYLFAMIVLLACQFANAGDLLLGEYTHHFQEYQCDGCDRFRDSHPLIGYASEKYAAFYMRNSYDKDSLVALRTFKYDTGAYVRPFAAVGVATGYSEFLPDLSAHGLTAVAYVGVDFHPKSDKWGVMINCVPGQFVGVGLRFSL